MALHLFNSLSRRIEEFVPIDPARVGPDGRPYVGLYCCGPTVYDYGHIGNFRTFVFADLVRRHLDFRGYSVRAVMNITDVEDKIIRRVRESGRPLREFTRTYEDAFLGDLKTLNCLTGEMPRATEHIGDIIALIQKLELRGLAYKTADGSVWFSIDKYQGCGCRYGVLKTIDFSQMRAGERVAAEDYEKEAAADFALWKARVPDDGEVAWDSPWGPGRPGWHIECSAMSMALLGPSFDLHLGGEDLAFPHHDCVFFCFRVHFGLLGGEGGNEVREREERKNEMSVFSVFGHLNNEQKKKLHLTDQVGVLDGRQPVRDDQRRPRPVRHRRIEPGLHLLLRLRVERRGRLVEDQDVRVTDQRAREREALALPSGEQAVCDAGAVAEGQRGDEVVGVGRAGRGDDLRARDGGAG